MTPDRIDEFLEEFRTFPRVEARWEEGRLEVSASDRERIPGGGWGRPIVEIRQIDPMTLLYSRCPPRVMAREIFNAMSKRLESYQPQAQSNA